MFIPHHVVIEQFIVLLRERYADMFGVLEPHVPGIMCWAARLALETIQRGDAAYHDLEHTIMVTQVGVAILEGRHFLDGGVTPSDWLNTVLALLCHDVGYVRGACAEDSPTHCARGDGTLVEMAPGATGAALAPFHVDRGKLFIQRRFNGHSLIDVRQVCDGIEHTRFPCPDVQASPSGYPELVRAADLIGQLADPDYLRKAAALFSELQETGTAEVLGYNNPDDLRRKYPAFYAQRVYPHVKSGLRYLGATHEGRQWVANLHNQLFLVEHSELFSAP